jgi:hypothetical protein
MPEKKIGKIFEQYQAEGCQYCGGGEGDIYIPKECWDAIIIEIRKLMLEAVGEDYDDYEQCCVSGHNETNCMKNVASKAFFEGYNQAKQEIRKRVEEL